LYNQSETEESVPEPEKKEAECLLKVFNLYILLTESNRHKLTFFHFVFVSTAIFADSVDLFN